MSNAPSVVRLGRHARDHCLDWGLSFQEVGDLVLAEHERRRRNPREADWLVAGRGLIVAYNWPDAGDPTSARVVTLWRQR